MKAWVAIALATVPAWATTTQPWNAGVTLGKDFKLTGRAHAAHKATDESLEIVEAEECDFKKTEDAIAVGSRCDYLSGTYRYRYQNAKAAHVVAVGFSLSKAPGDNHILLVSPAKELKP